MSVDPHQQYAAAADRSGAPGAPLRGSMGGPLTSYVVLLLALELGIAALGWSADVDETAFLVGFRWSATAGAVLAVALLVAGLRRAGTVATVVAVLAAVRLVVVPVVMLAVGWSDPSGRADSNYLLLVVLAVCVAAAAFVLAAGVARRLSTARSLSTGRSLRGGRPTGP